MDKGKKIMGEKETIKEDFCFWIVILLLIVSVLLSWVNAKDLMATGSWQLSCVDVWLDYFGSEVADSNLRTLYISVLWCENMRLMKVLELWLEYLVILSQFDWFSMDNSSLCSIRTLLANISMSLHPLMNSSVVSIVSNGE